MTPNKKLHTALSALILGVLSCTLPGARTEPEADTGRPPGGATASAVSPQAPPPTLSPEETADVILYNGTILTMDTGTIVSAIAIKNGRIQTLGGDARMIQLAGPDTIMIDLGGLTALPGFVDSHSHLFEHAGGDFAGVQDWALSLGITTTAQMFTGPDLAAQLVALRDAGALRMRVSMYLSHTDNCGAPLGLWYRENYPVSLEPDAMLQVPGVKMFSDGGSCGVPAVSFEYPNGNGSGDLYFTQESLADEIAAVQALGYQAAIHALGDRAILTALDALQSALAATGGENVLRHRIEHNTLLPDSLLPRYSDFRIVPTVFGAFSACIFAGDTSAFKYLTPEEYRFMEWRWRSLLDANKGLPVAWSSDFPVFSLNPMDHLFGFATRSQRGEDGSLCAAPEWAAVEAITVAEALRMMTIESAFALRRDHEIGSLAQGKLADLIVLSANPLETPLDALPDIHVLMTMVGGNPYYCREVFESVCP